MLIDISENNHKIWLFFLFVGQLKDYGKELIYYVKPKLSTQFPQLIWKLIPSLNLFDPGVFEAKATVYMSDRVLSPLGLSWSPHAVTCAG